MTKITRRQAIKASTAAAAVIGIPISSANADCDDPLVLMGQEFECLVEKLRAKEGEIEALESTVPVEMAGHNVADYTISQSVSFPLNLMLTQLFPGDRDQQPEAFEAFKQHHKGAVNDFSVAVSKRQAAMRGEYKEWSRQCGLSDLVEEREDMFWKVCDVAEQIRDTPATSIAGLKAKLSLMAYYDTRHPSDLSDEDTLICDTFKSIVRDVEALSA